MKKAYSVILLLSIHFCGNYFGFSQALPQSTAKTRPTIGLVLSGGGARGLAHIGVLRVLEQNHIPIDYIGGASFGALVGALYSIGKTPDEMEQLANSLDWNKYLANNSTLDDLSFRRKEDRRYLPSPIVLKGNIKDLKLPTALNSGSEIGLLLDKLTLPYALVDNFDNLPIPFRCVGTDMVSGQSVELKSGSLSRALRATMSIPGVFAPVELDGKILSDGGLVNNIPTNVVKAMGADILLVVNIETQLGSRQSIDNLLGVLAQTINIATADNSRRNLLQADIIIAPNLENYTATDFQSSSKIIELGFKGAEQKTALLRGLALNDADWQQHLRQRAGRQLTPETIVPTFLAVDGKSKQSVQTVEESLSDKYVNKPLDENAQKELSRDLTQLVGTGRFLALDYGLTEKDGKPGLIVRTNENTVSPSKPNRLELGFDVNSVETDNVNFNFLGRLTVFDVGRYGSELRTDLILGSNTLLGTEYYRPLGKSKYFFSPRASYSRARVNFFSNGIRTAEYVVQRAQAGIDVGYAFNLRSEMRLGYTIGSESATRRIGETVLPNLNGGFSNAKLGWTYNGLNSPQVPTAGILTQNTLSYTFSSPASTSGFMQAETRNLYFKQLNSRYLGMLIGNAGTSFRKTASPFHTFTLGGPFRLGGYGYDEFRASNYLQGGIGFLYNPKSYSSFLGGKVYVGAWYESGSAFEKWSEANYRQSVTGGVVVETPLGPVFLGTSINEQGHGKLYFSFGRIFRFTPSSNF